MPARRDNDLPFTTIRIRKETADRLGMMRDSKQTYDDVLDDMLKKPEDGMFFKKRKKSRRRKRRDIWSG